MDTALSRRQTFRLGAGAVLAGLAAAGQGSASASPASMSPTGTGAAEGGAAAGVARQRPAKPLVLGHRGACAHRPEHTLASYAKAIADGADFIEPDLVITRDGALVARHENNIAETTDVAAHGEFASRKTTKVIDGAAQTGWFTEDFTLAELKTLRAKERLGAFRPESQSYDGAFQIVTLEEIADFLAAEVAARGRRVGLIPEIKHSTYFASLGLGMEERFMDRLRASHYLTYAPVIVQSFEIANLKLLHRRLADLPLVQLMQLSENAAMPADLVDRGGTRTWAGLLTPEGLAEIASYADYLAPNFRDLIPVNPEGRLLAPTPLIAEAHRAGLLVGTWTFRPENRFIAANYRNAEGDGARNAEGSVAEIRRYLAAGVDAFFTDDPALGRLAVDK